MKGFRSKNLEALYVRNIIFGAEDSLVSTVGLLSGIAIAGVPRAEIILTGVVLILVEAFSMAAGSFISERSVEEYVHQRRDADRPSLLAGGVMFLSYLGAGFIPLAPYLTADRNTALPLSILSAVVALALLGVGSARFFRRSLAAGALRMAIVGGAAIAIGIGAGIFIR